MFEKLKQAAGFSSEREFCISETGNSDSNEAVGINAHAWQSSSTLMESRQINAHIRVLTKEEGGRHTPFFEGYSPTIYCNGQETTCVIHIPEGWEMMMPGDEANVRIDLAEPLDFSRARQFEIREQGRTLGYGSLMGEPQVSTSSLYEEPIAQMQQTTSAKSSPTLINAHIRVLSKEEGGRYTPFFKVAESVGHKNEY